MPNRNINPFETRSLTSYFTKSHLDKIRYSCARAVELDEHLGGNQESDYFKAALELSNAIRVSIGLSALSTPFKGVDVEPVKTDSDEPVETREDILEELAFPPTKEELDDLLSKKKIVAILVNPDNADLVEILGITLDTLKLKKADLLTKLYEGVES